MKKKVLILGRNSRATRLMITVLKYNDFDVQFIEERRDNNFELIKRRIKRLGLFRVFSQLLFQLFSKFQARTSTVKKRLELIESELIANVEDFEQLFTFSNINCALSLKAINELRPSCIVLSGTRILSVDFLAAIKCPIINIHAGITPAYRGVHGGYWALTQRQNENFGSTIHLVDEGIDTGAVIAHVKTEPRAEDNFSTYPLLQMRQALEILPTVLNNILNNKIETFTPNIPSAIWSHPTIWQYLYYRIKNGVK